MLKLRDFQVREQSRKTKEQDGEGKKKSKAEESTGGKEGKKERKKNLKCKNIIIDTHKFV